MKRDIDSALAAWAKAPNRKPLLLLGARQVGKTYALRELGRTNFDEYVHLDFSRDVEASTLFDGSIDPKTLVARIEAFLDVGIHPGKTLLVFDEVQLCERALTSLKYFCEDAPELHVAAAGSLLGVKINRDRYSFPVGKVDTLTLHPLNFEEYLGARGATRLAAAIREHVEHDLWQGNSFALHERALDYVREYLLVGGMPEVVKRFADAADGGTRDALEIARTLQRSIDQAYLADMTKYSTSSEAPNIFDAWRSVPNQLAKENHKFQYAKIRSGGRASRYETAIAWLEAAGIIVRCTQVTEGVAPLKMFENPSAFKLYLEDTGLLSAAYDALPDNLLPSNDKAARFRGGLAENYVLQQLVSRSSTPYYWGTPSKSEVEFVALDSQGRAIPIEVKSGNRVRSTSLTAYREKYQPPYVVRMSTRNFGFENDILSVPLYAACFFADSVLR